MNCPCKNKPAKAEDEPILDRYVSFIGLDCDAKAARLVERICAHVNDDEENEPFWEYFKQKIAGALGPRPDDLLLIHSHLNEIRELFEQKTDTEGTRLLDQIEEECC